ncbi:MAG: lipid-A-disaccharide synthase [Verrucomicrobiales bacterium]
MKSNPPITFYFVAGELSGDTHAASLMQSLTKRLPNVRFYGNGGPKMAAISQASAGKIEDWTQDAAVLGLWEVLRKYGYFKKRFDEMLEQILALQPDAVILVDYPGFNLRLAKALRKRGYTNHIIYYISPQVWAWNLKRIPKMAAILDLMICIFPFEPAYYEKHSLRSVFVGHPGLDHLPKSRIRGMRRQERLVGLFPGSRMREVKALFPVMLRAARRVRRIMPDIDFVVAAADERTAAEIRKLLKNDPICSVTVGNARELMQRASAGIIASGSATLEAAFFGLPYGIVYKVNPVTYVAAKTVVKVRFLGIINILAGREMVKEYIQGRANETNVMYEIFRLLEDDAVRLKMIDNMRDVIRQLGKRGASERAAAIISREFRPTP